MNKVTTINLNGNAYQLEEAGYELLKKYLDGAQKNLSDDPDKEEVLADFERAIAEKCAVHLNVRKTVISAKEVRKIIDDMGPVEAVETDEKPPKPNDSTSRPKRLYTLREGAVIGGVANGLAAYFNIDVTIVRLLFVLLVFVSGGVWILIYLLMMLIIPEAQTPEQRAELRGERFSAHDVLTRARRKYADISDKERWQKIAEQQPALSNAGNLLLKLVQIAAFIAGAGLGVLFGLLTAAWVSGLWWLAFGHPQLTDQLSTISLWTVAAGATAGYFIAALPVSVLAACCIKLGTNRQFGKQSSRWLASCVVLWVLAVGIAIGVVAVVGGRVGAYQTTHARINFDNHHICINTNLCGNNPVYYYQPDQPMLQ